MVARYNFLRSCNFKESNLIIPFDPYVLHIKHFFTFGHCKILKSKHHVVGIFAGRNFHKIQFFSKLQKKKFRASNVSAFMLCGFTLQASRLLYSEGKLESSLLLKDSQSLLQNLGLGQSSLLDVRKWMLYFLLVFIFSLVPCTVFQAGSRSQVAGLEEAPATSLFSHYISAEKDHC